jgi:dolichol kinase
VTPHPDASAAPPAAAPAARTTAPDERWRRTLHVASGGIGPLAAALGPRVASIGFAVLVAVAAAAEAARLTWPRAEATVTRLAGRLFRPAEAGRVSGASLLALGFALAWWLFPVGIAERAILVAAMADPMAATAGAQAGSVGHKSWEGTAACAVTAALVLLLTRVPLGTAAVAAVAAALAERVPWRGADNITVPVAVAVVLQALA